jgi:SAM-dependent methyltransferase
MTPVDLTTLAPGLRPVESGLYASARGQIVSYPTAAHEGCFELEEDSFWFLHRNAVLLAAVRAWPPPGLMVDVGGGNGFVSRALEGAGWDVVLLEPGADGTSHARARGLRSVACATWDEADFLPATLGGVGLFDVLEHVADDRALLRSLEAALAPGGRLYLTVPAHPWLWSEADRHAGHFRRYTRRSLHAKLAAAGFAIERLTHFFSFLSLPIFLGRTLGGALLGPRDLQALARKEHRPQGRLPKTIVTGLCRLEQAALTRGLTLPAGSSLLAVARKAAGS